MGGRSLPRRRGVLDVTNLYKTFPDLTSREAKHLLRHVIKRLPWPPCVSTDWNDVLSKSFRSMRDGLERNQYLVTTLTYLRHVVVTKTFVNIHCQTLDGFEVLTQVTGDTTVRLSSHTQSGEQLTCGEILDQLALGYAYCRHHYKTAVTKVETIGDAQQNIWHAVRLICGPKIFNIAPQNVIVQVPLSYPPLKVDASLPPVSLSLCLDAFSSELQQVLDDCFRFLQRKPGQRFIVRCRPPTSARQLADYFIGYPHHLVHMQLICDDDACAEFRRQLGALVSFQEITLYSDALLTADVRRKSATVKGQLDRKSLLQDGRATADVDRIMASAVRRLATAPVQDDCSPLECGYQPMTLKLEDRSDHCLRFSTFDGFRLAAEIMPLDHRPPLIRLAVQAHDRSVTANLTCGEILEQLAVAFGVVKGPMKPCVEFSGHHSKNPKEVGRAVRAICNHYIFDIPPSNVGVNTADGSDTPTHNKLTPRNDRTTTPADSETPVATTPTRAGNSAALIDKNSDMVVDDAPADDMIPWLKVAVLASTVLAVVAVGRAVHRNANL